VRELDKSCLLREIEAFLATKETTIGSFEVGIGGVSMCIGMSNVTHPTPYIPFLGMGHQNFSFPWFIFGPLLSKTLLFCFLEVYISHYVLKLASEILLMTSGWKLGS
jgi:hypothetical protein